MGKNKRGKNIHTHVRVEWKKYDESQHSKQNCQAARGSGNTPVYLRPRRQTEAVANHLPDPSRCHPQKNNRHSSRWGVLPYQPMARTGKNEGLKRRPKAYETYKAPQAGFAMPRVGVTVLPKRVLTKHRTNQTAKKPPTGQRGQS